MMTKHTKKEGNSRKEKDGRKILGQNYLFSPLQREGRAVWLG
jgi:hypothetical protein